MDTNRHEHGIFLSEDRLYAIAREEIAKRVLELDPIIRKEIERACQVIDESRGVRLLRIQGKDPKRTFRRLMNKWRVEKVPQIGWRYESLLRELDKHTLNKKRAELRAVA